MEESKDPCRAHFAAIPWCAEFMADPAFYITPTLSREPKASTEDSLFAETLRSAETITAALTLSKYPTSEVPRRIEEVRTFFSLGKGMNGYPHVCHGGMVATMLDETMGLLLSSNKDLENAAIRAETVTVQLNVQYLKPVATPQTVVVTAVLREIKGRKHYIDGTIMDESGEALAKAETLWMTLKSSEKL
jgi:acyl-coenzyme A thioesterase PaaI-like protein